MELMVKQGYKQTEVGLIPEDWNVYRFEDLGDTIIGLTYKPVDVNITGKLVHRSSNIQNNKLAYHDNVYVTCHVPEKLILRKDDILICVRNGSRDLIGKSAIIQGISIGETFGAFMSVFRPRIYPPLVYQYFISNIVQSQINASLGATINQITNKTLNSFITVFPPTLSEQKAIATALSDVDELITNLDKLIAKKKAIKQGAMQQLLTPPHKGGKRLAGFSDEWKEKKLGDYSYCIRGVSYSGDKDLFSHDNNNSIRLLRSNNVYEKKILFEDLQYVNKEKVSEHQMMKENDILICMANGSKALVGKAGQFKEGDYEYTFGAFMGVLRPVFAKCDPDFIFQQLSTYDFRCHLDILLSGSSINNLRPSDIESFTFYSPDIVEQKAIAKILYDMDLEIEKLENKQIKYQSIKLGMMQELLTGKTRLI